MIRRRWRSRPSPRRARCVVRAGTCGLESTGSGFVVAPGYVLTNAHVIAGGRTIRVNGATGTYDATPVVFDPELDVALLRVPDLPAPALPLAGDDPERGTPAAVLGYPNGGPLRIVAAAVADTYPALGRNIYATEYVRRQIVEIRSDIERGNSGGPLMLPDGTVGGVVFAEARTDEEVGYALSAGARVGTDRACSSADGAGRHRGVPAALDRRCRLMSESGASWRTRRASASRTWTRMSGWASSSEWNSRCPSTSSRQGVSQVALTVRRPWSSSAISPRKSPGPRVRIVAPARWIRTSPSRIM